MSWGTGVDKSGKGNVWSNDYNTDSDGIIMTSIQDVHELVKCIDYILEQGMSRNFIRREDNKLVEVKASEKYPGKYIIERVGGNWIRLTREEIWDLRNELLRRIASR